MIEEVSALVCYVEFVIAVWVYISGFCQVKMTNAKLTLIMKHFSLWNV